MSWDIFDKKLSGQRAKMQADFETEAMNDVQAAVASGSSLREAVSAAVQIITDEDNWLALVYILQERPLALAADMDQMFYNKCPQIAIEELVAGEKGIFSSLIDRLNEPIEEEKLEWVRKGDERLMHMVVNSMLALKQIERLKKVAKMLQDICENRYATEGQRGRLPGTVYHKFVDNKIIERAPHTNGSGSNGNGYHVKPEPARRIESKGGSDMDSNTNQPVEELGKLIKDQNPAKPPKGSELPDSGLKAKLSAATQSTSASV